MATSEGPHLLIVAAENVTLCIYFLMLPVRIDQYTGTKSGQVCNEPGHPHKLF